MRSRLWPALAGLAVAALTAFTMPAVAAATVAASPATPSAAIKVNLRSAFAGALSHTSTGPRAGIVRPAGEHARAGAARAASGCTEPDCNLSFGGGFVQHSPHVYLLLWGPKWQTCSPTCGADYDYLSSLYHGLGVTAQDSWSTVTSQYGDGSGHSAFSGTVFVNAYQDASAPPNPVIQDALAAEADSLISTAGITDLADAQVVVAAQPGTCFSDGFAGNCGAPDNSGIYCAWHSYTSSNLPLYQPALPARRGHIVRQELRQRRVGRHL